MWVIQYIKTEQTLRLLDYNMYAYGNNNPIIHTDYSGEFPWLIVGVLAIFGIVGGILGYNSDVKLGDSLDVENEDFQANNSIVDAEQEELSTGDKIKNTIIGTGLGLCAGGATLVLVGSGASLVVGSAFTTIGFLGATGAQTVAVGALAYNILAMLIAPFFGQEIEPLEL